MALHEKNTVRENLLDDILKKGDGFIFLTFFINRCTGNAFREFKRRIKELTGRSWFVSMEYRYKKLSQYIRGWMNYFGIPEYYRPIPEIDEWLRRKMRMCCWKRWRYTRTKVRELRRLGTSLKAAMMSGSAGKAHASGVW